MMSTNRILLGIRIEGIGSQTTKADGLMMYFGTHTPPSDAHEWWPALASIPSSVDDAVDPYTGAWQTSSFTFPINASDRVRQLLCHEQTEWVASLAEEVDASETDLEVDSIGALPANYSPLYLNDETLLVTYKTGTTMTVTRGIWRSAPRAHGLGSRVFAKKPYWRDRIIEFCSYNLDTEVLTVRWRGYVDDIQTSDDGTIVELSATSFYARWQGAEVRQAQDLNQSKELSIGERGLRGRFTGANGSNTRPDFYRDEASYASNITFYSRVGDSLIKGRYIASYGASTVASALPKGGSDPLGDLGTVHEAVYPLLVWDRTGALTGESCHPLLSTPNPYHPLVIARELLTGSLLDRAWALPLEDHLDLTLWQTAIDQDPHLAIDQLMLGWEGPYKPFEAVQTLLRAYGYYLAMTQDGRLGLGRLGSPTIGDYSTRSVLSPYRGGLTWSNPLGRGSSTLKAEVGSLPWSDPREITVNVTGVSSRASALREAEEDSLDLSCIYPSRGVEIANRLGEGAYLTYQKAPLLTFEAPDHTVIAADYGLGRWIQLSDLGGLENEWLVDAQGDLIPSGDLSSRLDLLGQIISRRWDVATSTYTLTIMALAYRSGAVARYRGPAAKVLSSSLDGADLACEGSDFVYGEQDGDAFLSGDEVEIWTRDGKRWGPKSIMRTVVSVTDGDITLDSGYGQAVPAGSVVRLADSERYSNGLVVVGFDRAYAYLAASSGQIKGPDEYEDADVWSSILGV